MATAPKNPEVILRKRRNIQRVRDAKREEAKSKALAQNKAHNTKRKGKFIRPETLIARHRATERERYRVKRVTKFESDSLEGIEKDPSKIGTDKLIFIVRIKGPYNARIPSKALKVLEILRLQKVDTGTFAKCNNLIRPLLRLASPYIVIGEPSLATVRNLIQKRARVRVSLAKRNEILNKDEVDEGENYGGDENGEVSVPLNDNNYIEGKLGKYGVICTEDIIHEIATLGDNFKNCIKFMEPFTLSPPVTGWTALSKLKRIEHKEKMEQFKPNNSSRAPLNIVDIDKYIASQL